MGDNRIKEFRKFRRLSQKQLAEKIGISQSFLSELENGKYDIGMELIKRIGSALDICPHILVRYDCSIDCAYYCIKNLLCNENDIII